MTRNWAGMVAAMLLIAAKPGAAAAQEYADVKKILSEARADADRMPALKAVESRNQSSTDIHVSNASAPDVMPQLDPAALKICTGYYKPDDRNDCLKAVANHSFDPAVLDFCGGYDMPFYTIQCLGDAAARRTPPSLSFDERGKFQAIARYARRFAGNSIRKPTFLGYARTFTVFEPAGQDENMTFKEITLVYGDLAYASTWEYAIRLSPEGNILSVTKQVSANGGPSTPGTPKDIPLFSSEARTVIGNAVAYWMKFQVL